jgi:molecular chaperone DnaJ
VTDAPAAERDYYEVLGVSRDADAETIKKAFRARARELHPDVSTDPEAAEKFSRLAEAYDVLSRSRTRLLYDHFGYRGRGNGWFSAAGTRAAADFVDLLTFAKRKRARPVAEVAVDEFEARRGARRRVTYSSTRTCDSCSGTGAAEGADVSTCPTCNGSGNKRVDSELDGARLLQVERCPDCHGTGNRATEACPACGGVGTLTEERSGEVEIPPGAKDGDRITLPFDSRAAVTVRVVHAPRDHWLLRYVAALGLLVALVFLYVLLR